MTTRLQSQTPPLSKVDSIETADIKELKKSIKNLKDSLDSVNPINAKKYLKPKTTVELGFLEWMIVWMPVLLFIILFYYLMRRLRAEGFKLADALSSCDPLQIDMSRVPDAVTNASTTADLNTANPITTSSKPEIIYVRSSSRLIAFMSGLSAIVIAISLMTFYYYDILANVGDPNSSYLDSAWKVIAGLGIGVIPYGFNMLKEAQKV